MRILEHPSPNFGPRRDGLRPSLVLLHHTAMETAEAALDRLCDPEAEVSCHYLIARDGRVWRLVDEAKRAWHAGLGRWKGLDDINSRSIGIELANPASLEGFPPFPELQMAALEALLREILSRWGIPAEGVIGHSDIAPERKADPGPKFDWGRLALHGLAAPSVVSEAGDVDWNAFETRAAAAGYDVADNSAEAVLRAVRLRHRPWAEGKAPDAWDVGCLTQTGEGQD